MNKPKAPKNQLPGPVLGPSTQSVLGPQADATLSLSFVIRYAYGIPRYYPASPAAVTLCKLLGQTTMTKANIDTLQELSPHHASIMTSDEPLLPVPRQLLDEAIGKKAK